MKISFLLLILVLSQGSFAEDLSREERELSEKINKACDLPLKVDLHDYTYGRDEASLYSNLHFEDAAFFTAELEEACKTDPANRKKLARVGTLYFKRGSYQERRLLQRKNGDLVYLAGRPPSEYQKSKDAVIREDLKKVLKLSFEKPIPKEETPAFKAAEEAKAQATQEKAQVDQQKKIDALTAWFQGEMKKITANPTDPKMGAKLEALTKTYEEKLNALTNTP